MRQDHPAELPGRPAAPQLGRDLGAWWQTRHQGLRRARQEGRLHAPGENPGLGSNPVNVRTRLHVSVLLCLTGNRPTRRVLDTGNHDVLWVDLRHAQQRDSGAVGLPA